MDAPLAAFASILQDLQWIAIALVFAFTCLVWHFYDRVSRYPRGPFPVPVFGNLLALRKVENLHDKAIEWSKTYGDVFTLWVSHKPMVILNSYDVIQEAFLKRKHVFSGRIPTKMRDIQNHGNHDVMFEDYTLYGKALRKVASMAVRKYAVTKSLERLCSDIVDAHVDTLTMEPQIVDSRKLFFSMLYKLTGASIYGASLNGEEEDILRLEQIDHEYYAASPDGLPSDIAPILGLLYRQREKKIEVLYTEYRQIVHRLFAKAEESYKAGSKENIVHGLISAREEAIREKESDAEYLTKENLVQVVMNLFGGATDTSASALQWMFLRLAKHPEIQKRIQKEIEDCIGTAAIPKDTGVLFNVYGVNHDPRFWDEPEKFRPDRFLDPVTGRLRQDAGPLLSFGLGTRACPGEKLAHVDIFYILVRFMQRVSCSAIDNASCVDMRSIGSSLFFLPAQRDICLAKRN
ncbi:cytochrome P450 1A1-like isoform X2 [Dermacentor variabilis]